MRTVDDSHQGFLDQEGSDGEYDPYKPEAESKASSDLQQYSTFRPSSSGSNWLSILAIVGGLLAGIGVMIGNHIFFAFLVGKRSNMYSQFWITTAKNAFPQVVQVALGVSMSCSLTHAVHFKLFFVHPDLIKNLRRFGTTSDIARIRYPSLTACLSSPASHPCSVPLLATRSSLFCPLL